MDLNELPADSADNIGNDPVFYRQSIIIGLIISCASGAAWTVYTLLRYLDTLELGVIMLPFAAFLIAVAGSIFILLTLLITRFIKIKFKFLLVVLIESILITITWWMTHLSEIKALACLFIIPGYIISIYGYIRYKHNISNIKTLTYIFVISLIVATLIICLAYYDKIFIAETDLNSKATINLQAIINPPEMLNKYIIYYMEDRNNNKYQKISIVDSKGKQESSVFFQGDLVVYLLSSSNDIQDENFSIGSLRVKEDCESFNRCSISWQKGVYRFYLTAAMYGNTANREDTKKRLQESINNVVTEINKRSDYLVN